MLHGWLWITTFTGVVALTVLALPVAALAVRVLALRRRARGAANPWRTALADVAMVHGTVPWVWIILLPGERPGEVIGRVSLVPFQDLANIVRDGAWLAIVGNLLVFAALGFFAPLRFPRLASARRMLMIGAQLSLPVLGAVSHAWKERRQAEIRRATYAYAMVVAGLLVLFAAFVAIDVAGFRLADGLGWST